MKKNTLLCDDSVSKTRYNEPENIVIVQEFTGDVNDVVCWMSLQSYQIDL